MTPPQRLAIASSGEQRSASIRDRVCLETGGFGSTSMVYSGERLCVIIRLLRVARLHAG
jgi:hypothetical protein